MVIDSVGAGDGAWFKSLGELNPRSAFVKPLTWSQ